MNLLYEKHNSSVKDLLKKYPSDAGIDLQSFGTALCPCNPSTIPPLLKDSIKITPSTQKIFTGIKVFIPQGYFGLLTTRSSARNRGVICQSIIDSEYTGWLMPFVTFTQDFILYPGDRLLQLVIVKQDDCCCIVDNVSSIITNRGTKGVGSTGK